MGMYASSRNFGYGQKMEFAGKQALRSYYGGGHHASVATHSTRFGHFAAWTKEQGIRDAQKVDQAVLDAYGKYLRGAVKNGGMGVAYAQNLLSTVNVTLAALRGDEAIKISPSKAVGERSNTRTETPGGIDRNQTQTAVSHLHEAGLIRAAAVAGLARAFGLRQREATLANLDRWKKEAARLGKVNVKDGTKGGRGKEVDRWVTVTEAGAAALTQALAARPTGSQNLLSSAEATESYIQFVKGELSSGRRILKESGIDHYHDLRAAFACERYWQLTGHAAPVVTGKRTAGRAADQQARQTITLELGHGRIDVLNAYIGGRGR